MTELSSVERLAKLRALEEWLTWQLQHTRRKIGDLEWRVRATDGYVSERERRAGRPTGTTIHVADCARIDHPVATLDATKAQFALVKDGGFHHPCEHCRPDKALGITKD
jgi:hypothetical protein